jgi:2-succinyl-5-enolpyruvyl-6-hydroxy-3-cyclohexene-1-carboxylate synthase
MKGNAPVIAALFAELDALGVREFCVCAGARNAPLIEVLARRGSLMRRFFDERAAAFFALGRVMRTRAPVAVLTTSGTAAAELLPAIIEAHYQHLPLVAITADRPSRYAGSGAPQAIEQRDLFGEYAARTVEIECSADGGFAMSDGGWLAEGVVHFNVRLEEGLENTPPAQHKVEAEAGARGLEEAGLSALDLQSWNDFWAAEGDLVVLAAGLHPADVPAARDFLLRLNAPVLAEATANLHAEDALGHLMLRGGEKALRDSGFKRVLRLGAVPSWRWWRDLEARDDIAVLGISHAPFRGLARSNGAGVVPWNAIEEPVHALPAAIDRAADPAALLARLLDENPDSEPAWMRHLSRVIGAGATVFLGNSLPIREWNLAADRAKPGTAFFANRGANGIDGLVSTGFAVSAESGEAWLIVGDLSALYDMNGPWILSQLPAAKRRIVVVNNGGGKIFSQVAWLRGMSPEAKSVMENAHAFSFESWARMWGMDYRLFKHSREVRDDGAACCVWEIRPDPEEGARFWSAWRG